LLPLDERRESPLHFGIFDDDRPLALRECGR
jgi:hypothetical protein